jgi:hypothetical protein
LLLPFAIKLASDSQQSKPERAVFLQFITATLADRGHKWLLSC